MLTVMTLFIFLNLGWAEETVPKVLEPAAPSVDAGPWLVTGVLDVPVYTFYLGAPAVKGVAYLPNFAPRLGARVLYKNIGGIMTFGLPIPEREIERRGDSKQTNIVLSNYWRRMAMDVYYQRIRGFYANSPFTEFSTSRPDRYPQFPDTRVLNVGANGYYVLNPDTYSLKAAFEQTEFQQQSGGSWILHAFANHTELSIGDEFIPGSSSSELTEVPNVASGRFDTWGVAAGYGQTWIRRYLFVTGQIVWGPGIQYQELQRRDGTESTHVSIAAKLNINAAVGYNSTDYVAGAKVIADSIWARVETTEVSSSLVTGQLFYGQHF